jgi:hypothetical protein
VLSCSVRFPYIQRFFCIKLSLVDFLRARQHSNLTSPLNMKVDDENLVSLKAATMHLLECERTIINELRRADSLSCEILKHSRSLWLGSLGLVEHTIHLCDLLLVFGLGLWTEEGKGGAVG